MVERTAWTDERLDDLARRMDAGFDRVDADIRELRAEIRNMRTELRGAIVGTRAETRDDIGGLRGEIDALRVTMVRVGGAMMVTMTAGFLSVIAAVLAGS